MRTILDRISDPGEYITEEDARATDETADILRHKDLRDRFAIAALTGICASGPSHNFSNEILAREAYGLADAMMVERDA